jgi:hypothetical protein
MKKKLLLSILTLVMCFSLMAGATFALFTSESKVNVAISSGKVSMEANIEGLTSSHIVPNANNDGYDVADGLFAGEASIANNILTLSKLVPGDTVEFTVKIYNSSNVKTKYQTLIGVDSDNGLFSGLVVTIDEKAFNGVTAASDWQEADPVSERTEIKTIKVSIALPEEAENQYQDKACQLFVAVNAVQGNALCTNPMEKTVEIYSAFDMAMLSNQVNAGDSLSGWTVKLMNDIDMAQFENFAPIGVSGKPFAGTFDGQNHVISNVVLTGTSNVGLFGYVHGKSATVPAKITNVTIKNATVTGLQGVGSLVGLAFTNADVVNCAVKGDIKVTGSFKVGGIIGGLDYSDAEGLSVVGNDGSFVKGEYIETDLEGDNVGGAIGFIADGPRTIKNVVVDNVDVSGSRKVAGVLGVLHEDITLDNASYSNGAVEIVAPEEYITDNYTDLAVGGIVGECHIGSTLKNSTIKNATIKGYNPARTGDTNGGPRKNNPENVCTLVNVKVESDVEITFIIKDVNTLTEALANFKSGYIFELSSSLSGSTIAFDDNRTLFIIGEELDNLTINAPLGTVYVGNDMETLIVVAVADESLHVDGEVDRVVINSGRVVVEKEGNVKEFGVTGSGVTIEFVEGKQLAEGKQAPVIIKGEGTTVTIKGGIKDSTGNVVTLKYEDYDVVVSTADELIAALEAGKNVLFSKNITIDPANLSNAYGTTGITILNGQTINGNGFTLDVKGANGTWDSGINTTGGTIKNITVTGSFRGIFINHNSDNASKVILENVIIDGTIYTISCDQGTNNGLEATNCTFNGWTSFADTLGDVKFVNCSFGAGNGYKFARPYASTEFVGCNFADGYELDAQVAVTFENCTIGGVDLTADNLATLVTSNIQNATIK